MSNVATKKPDVNSALMAQGGVPSGPLDTIAALHDAWHSWEGRANIVSPVAAVDAIPALHAVSLRAVVIDPDPNGQEVYVDPRFRKGDQVALGGKALEKIAAAAGANIIERRRLDDRSDPCYCEIEITLGIRDLDGVWRQTTKAKEVDLRGGAAEATKAEYVNKQKTGKMIPLDATALADRRRHIQSLAETKAFYRAIRTLLVLKQKYSKAELAKPFIVPKLVPALDPSDPDQKHALIQMAIGREASLYGPLGGGEPMRELRDVTPEPAAAIPADVAPQPEAKPEPQPSTDDFEPLEFEPTAPAAVCGCPCGDQAELTEEIAKITTERCGAPRCRDCFPGPRFQFTRHERLGSLDLPKHPGLTVDQIAATLKKAGKL